MIQNSYIPRKDEEFFRWTFNFISYLASKAEQFNFPQEVSDSIQTKLADFGEKLRIADEPNTRTPVAVQAKNTAHKLLEKTVRNAVTEYLTHNHLVSDDDRVAMGIPVHKTTHTPSPVAHEAPDVDVDTSVLGCVTIHFFEKGHHHKKAKPAGQHGAEIAWVISDVPVTSTTKLIHSSFDTHTPLTLDFQDHDQRGQILYFAIRWENTRGEKGPWSAIQSTVIP
jgi:hypothetical protein